MLWHTLLAAMLWLGGTSLAAAAEFEVTKVSPWLAGDRYLMNLQIRYQFSAVALEALDNGVPLLVDVHVRVRRKKAWFWEKEVEDRHFYQMIRYHALSETYQVHDLDKNKRTTFQTREAAIAALGELSRVVLVDADRLEPGVEYHVRVRASLDKENLPLPIRPLAYFNPSWNLSSGWTKWSLNP